MEFINGKDLEIAKALNPANTVLILSGGVFQQMQLQAVLDYLAGAQVTTDATLRHGR